MSERDTAQELADLRSQLEALQAQRASENSSNSMSEGDSKDDSESAPEWLSDWLDANGELDPDSIVEELRSRGLNWLEDFDEDLAGAKPSSILAVFALGFLVGKISA